MSDRVAIHDLLRADPVDTGCDAAILVLDEYVERELAGEPIASCFPGTAAHLRACDACRLDHESLLAYVSARP